MVVGRRSPASSLIVLQSKLRVKCGLAGYPEGMGRPALDIGTAGKVRIYPAPAGGYDAQTRFRDLDGKVRTVQRHGTSRSAADRALRLALRDRIQPTSGRELTPDSKVKVLAQMYLNDVAVSDRSPSMIAQYQDRVEKQILPPLSVRSASES